MIRMTVLAAASALGGAIAFSTMAAAAELTAATQEMLKEMKLGTEVLDGLDKELALPATVLEAARKEGSVRVQLTVFPGEFENLIRMFKARYPGIEITYKRGVGREAAIAPLIAFSAGNLTTDVVASFEEVIHEYRKAGAVIDLRDLPTYHHYPEEMNETDGISRPYIVNYWCIAYNTSKVKKAELPKTWDELLDNPRWRGGAVGALNRVHLWFAPLWGVKGDAWANDYMRRYFTVVKPQLRKEGMSAALKLLGIGEFDIMIPAPDSQVYVLKERGVPVDFHCPDPAPVVHTIIGIMKGSPSENAAKVFVNWLLSKEGQLGLFHYTSRPSAHTGFTGLSLNLFPETVAGKKTALDTHRVQAQLPKLSKEWQGYWTIVK